MAIQGDRQQYTRLEILGQAGAWSAAVDSVAAQRERIRDIFGREQDRAVVFIGCGSPYFLCQSAAASYLQLSRKSALALPASDIAFDLNAALPAGPPPIVIAVSRTGETTELIAACQRMAESGSPLIAVTIAEASSLTRLADVSVAISSAGEKSLAQTKSFSAMLIATLGLVSIAAGETRLLDELRGMANAAGRIVEVATDLARTIVDHPFRRAFFLGSGPRYGIAREGMMKMTEMSLTDANAYSLMEFRHGPQTMVDEDALVVGLLSPGAPEHEIAVLAEMGNLGATVLAIGLPEDERRSEMAFVFPSSGFTTLANLLDNVPILQLLALHQAEIKGVDPDMPRHLARFVNLTGSQLPRDEEVPKG